MKKFREFIGEIALTVALGFILFNTDFNDDSVGQWLYWVFGSYGVLMLCPKAIQFFLKDRLKP